MRRWGRAGCLGAVALVIALVVGGLMTVAPTDAEATVAQPGPEVPRATPTELPGTSPVVHDLNNEGEAVGESGGRPVLWRDGEAVTLATDQGVATEINDRGDVLVEDGGVYHWRDGRATRIDVATDAVDLNERGQALVGPPFGVWDADSAAFTAIQPPSSRQLNAYDISDAGHVAGLVYGGDLYLDTGAFVWRAGTLTRLGRLSPWHILRFTAAVNTSGGVVGLDGDDGHGVIWRDGVATPLGLRPVDINDRGQVVGLRGETQAAVWDDGVLTDLGSLGQGGRPVAINDRGQVVGYHQYSDGLHYFVWTKGWRVDLGLAADPEAPISINERGQVAVTTADRGAVVWQIDDEGVEPPTSSG